MEFNHITVMLNEAVEALNLRPGMTVVDATFGGGGHSMEIIKKIGPTGTLVAIDRDMDAIENAKNFVLTNKNVHLVQSDFANLDRVLDELQIETVDAVLADLGLSSHQIDTPDRGFSYMNDAALDMRMDATQKMTAYTVVNKFDERNLADAIAELGDERYARRIAAAIVSARPIDTTLQLAKIITDAVPGNYFKFFGHPAKKTFQAIRIIVNGELDGLEKFIHTAHDRLATGGHMAFITFHSGEDRIVKHAMKHWASNCTCPPKTPICICGHRATVEILTKKPLLPSTAEQKNNPRSHSAKLRIAKKM
ncbi:MAG: 16S rRNA (cytosine(1402)-N(4))-methyltransferase RsmH [Firmicutes bacterium]|nr:16S rRNA (cytosine(1402)-N(4))-methyltransferase RsmH [Bacillota bacterium]